MARLSKKRLVLLSLVVPAILLSAFSWISFSAVQRMQLSRPLVDAVKRHDTAAVRALLDQGADPGARDVPERPFTWEQFWQSLRPGATKDTFAPPVLQLAILQGDTEIARMLILKGVEVNAISGYWPEVTASAPATPITGFTALMDAAYVHKPEIVRLLLEHHADPNLHPYDAIPPLTLALKANETTDNGEVERMKAAQTEIVKMLLEHGADARYVGPNGESAAQMAIDSDWPAVRLLVERGADPNMRVNDRWKRTLLIEAAVIEDADMIKFLVEHGANVNAADTDGRTALMEVCRRYEGQELSLDAVRLLLEHGANLNTQDKDGLTALMEAAGVGRRDGATVGNVGAIQLLLQYGADINRKDKAGRTALQKLLPVQAGDNYTRRVVQVLQQAAGH